MHSLTSKPRLPFRTLIAHGWWPSFLKVAYYRLLGYRLGRNVRLAFGSVIIGRDVERGDGTQVGFFAVLRGERLHLGKRVQIGALCFLDTPRLQIGDDSKFNEQVFVGGLQGPASSLTVGRRSQIQQLTFINPAVSVTIGDNTSIGGHTLIFGHQSWLSVLDGYPADFRPIEIGSNVGVAWRVFIGPGAKIGDGAMIGTNSLVNRTIPPRCLAMGTPAKVIAREPYFPRRQDEAERIALLQNIVGEFERFLTGHGFSCKHRANGLSVDLATHLGSSGAESQGSLRLRYRAGEQHQCDQSPGGQLVYLSLVPVASGERGQFTRSGVLWLDIASCERGSVEHAFGGEVIQFLLRFGIRFACLERE